jgi:hypothetical protein
MNTAVETATTASTPAVVAAPRVRNLTEAVAYVLAAIGEQNEIDVVSSEAVEVKVDGKRGRRIELILSGAGVGDPTRRYFLRENSAFATAIGRCEGLVMHAPKKARGSTTYQINFGTNADFVNYEAPAPEKAKKELMTPEARKQARLDGKARAKAARLAAEAEAAANAPAELESAETVIVDEPELVAA